MYSFFIVFSGLSFPAVHNLGTNDSSRIPQRWSCTYVSQDSNWQERALRLRARSTSGVPWCCSRGWKSRYKFQDVPPAWYENPQRGIGDSEITVSELSKLNDLLLKAGVGQNISMYTSFIARNFFLVLSSACPVHSTSFFLHFLSLPFWLRYFRLAQISVWPRGIK